MNRQVAAIVMDTFEEARARKVLTSMALSSALAVAALYWMMRGMALSGPSSMVALLGHIDQRYLNEQWVARGIFGNASMLVVALQLISCLMHTMSFVPGLMEQGRNAWLVSHPISRTGILLGRFLGCLALAFGSTALTFSGAWVVIGLKTGLWHFPFFFGLVTTLLLYASLAAGMLLVQLVSSSPALMVSGVSVIGALNSAVSRPEELKAMVGDGAFFQLLAGVAGVFPRASEVARLTDAYVQTGALSGSQHLWVSAVFGMICLALASWCFTRKDF